MQDCHGVSIATLFLHIAGKFVKEIKIKKTSSSTFPNKCFSCWPLPDILMAIA